MRLAGGVSGVRLRPIAAANEDSQVRTSASRDQPLIHLVGEW